MMRVEIILRALGRCEKIDAEAIEQGARAEGVGRQFLADRIEIMIGAGRIERDLEPKHLGEHMIEPQPRGRAAEQVIVGCEQPPRRARIGCRRAVAIGYAQRGKRDALAVEHAIDIMIRREQQAGRIGPRRIVGEPARIGVAVRADDRRIGDGGVKRPRDIARAGIRREQSVGVQLQRPAHARFPAVSS